MWIESVVARAPALLVTLLVAVSANAAGGADDDGPLVEVRARIEAGEHAAAITDLQKLLAEDADNADVLNLLGYSHRRSGDLDTAQDYYQRALAVKPEHRGANEYLGELHLERGDLAAAEGRLAVLDDACFFGCDEYSELKRAIADYRKAHGL